MHAFPGRKLATFRCFSEMELTNLMATSKSVETPSPVIFLQVKMFLDVVVVGPGLRSHREGDSVCTGGDPEHIFHTFPKCLTVCTDFCSFALCLSGTLFECAHCSTDLPSLFVVVYPQSGLWLLKYHITMCGLFPCPNAESEWFWLWFCTWIIQHQVAPL